MNGAGMSLQTLTAGMILEGSRKRAADAHLKARLCSQPKLCRSHVLSCVCTLCVQTLNRSVVAEGAKKVDVLKATKDFKKGIYSLQWEHTSASKEVGVQC